MRCKSIIWTPTSHISFLSWNSIANPSKQLDISRNNANYRNRSTFNFIATETALKPSCEHNSSNSFHSAQPKQRASSTKKTMKAVFNLLVARPSQKTLKYQFTDRIDNTNAIHFKEEDSEITIYLVSTSRLSLHKELFLAQAHIASSNLERKNHSSYIHTIVILVEKTLRIDSPTYNERTWLWPSTAFTILRKDTSHSCHDTNLHSTQIIYTQTTTFTQMVQHMI